MEQSASIDLLTAALVKAAAKFKPLKPDKTNPHFKSKFASLQQCIEVTRPALLEAGVFVGQFMEPAPDGFLGVTTQLQCGDQWQRSVLFMPVAQATPQGAGSAITYARRYAYCAALGLAPDEDDDGNSAETPPKQTRKAPEPGTIAEHWLDHPGEYRLGNMSKSFPGKTLKEISALEGGLQHIHKLAGWKDAPESQQATVAVAQVFLDQRDAAKEEEPGGYQTWKEDDDISF